MQCAAGDTRSSSSKQTAQFRKHSRISWGQGQDRCGIARKRDAENRAHRDDKADDGEEGDREGYMYENDSKRCKSGSSHSQSILKWYACPFHKHDSEYFNSNKATRMRFKSCGAKGWTEICRLKEHLYRVHKNPPKCDKCQKVFLKQDQLKAHLRDQNNTDCKWMPEIPSKGISPEVVTELRKRKKSTMTDEEKWFDIWHLLFPNESSPDSAYSDPCKNSDSYDDGDFHEYLDQRMPRFFNTRLNASLDGIGLTKEQKKMVNKLSTALESSLRKQLWESYLAGPTADNDLSSDDTNEYEPIESTSTSMLNEEFGFEFDQSSFAYYQQYGLDPTGSSEQYTAYNSDYHTPQFAQPRGLENTRPVTPSSSRCIPQSSTSARQPSKEYELALERSLPSGANADTNYINPTQLMAAPTVSPPLHDLRLAAHP